MKREIITTKDGSKTIHLPEWNENYHSHHGAYQEAMHVFIESGLNHRETPAEELAVLEIGFGTGLNALLTLLHAPKETIIHYHGLEAFPVHQKELTAIDYTKDLSQLSNLSKQFTHLHEAPWNTSNAISPRFHLTKINKQLNDFQPDKAFYDLIYFDAFGPRVQPEMWTLSVFEKIYASLKPQGILVTYCAKGQVRRDLMSAGFTVEKIPGPPGKREMLRATK